VLAAALLSVALLTSGATEPAAAAPEATSDQVIATFVAALDNHDMSRAAQLIALNAHVLVPQPIDGREAIARWLTAQFPGDAMVEVSSYAANGQRVTWLSRVSHGAEFQLNWDESVVVDGQIAYWSVRGLASTMVMPPLQRARALEPVPSVIQGLAPDVVSNVGDLTSWLWLLGALGTASAGGLFGLWRRGHQPPERQSRQGGRMLLNLRNRPRA
jgi:hypothetical protein